jgi:hypothetical protein
LSQVSGAIEDFDEAITTGQGTAELYFERARTSLSLFDKDTVGEPCIDYMSWLSLTGAPSEGMPVSTA